MKGKNTSRICRVCLRTDRYLGDINPALSKFHYELCLFYSSEIYNSRFCAECEHMLKKMYNFKEKCKKAAKLYHDFMHNLLPAETCFINITELYTLMPESPLGHWMPANNKMFSYEEGVDTELDEIDNIEICGEIKQRSLKTYCKPKYIMEKIQRNKKMNLYKERRMRAAQQWAENKDIPAKTPVKVHETNTVPNVNLQPKTPSNHIAVNTEFNKKVIPVTPDPISVVSNQTITYITSDTDDDNDYEDSIVIADPLIVPFKDDMPNTPKPVPITKECSVVLTPLKILRPVRATPNILKKHSVKPLATIQEVVSSNKTLSQKLPKYLTEPLLKGGKFNVPAKLAGNGKTVTNKASLMETPNTTKLNTQEKNFSQSNVNTIYLLNADAHKITPSTNMPVKVKHKNTTLNAVQKENTEPKETPARIPTHINRTLTTVQKVNTASKDMLPNTISENTITEPKTDTSGFKIEYPKMNLQDLLLSKPDSEIIMEDDLFTDWDNVIEIETEELIQPESEVLTLIEPNVKLAYDARSREICRKLLDKNSVVQIKIDQEIPRKRSANVSLSSDGDIIYKEKTLNSNVNERNHTNDNAKRIKMNHQDGTQTRNIQNIGSNDPNTIDDMNTIMGSEVDSKEVKKVQQVQRTNINRRMRRKAEKELRRYTKERLKAALLIKFATCGELKSDDVIIDTQFVMECLDRRVPETVLRRLWRYVLRDVKGRSDSKMNFSPDTLRTFRVVQKRYMNEKLYQEVFDIQYLTTEQEVLEEFQMRKYYPCYTSAINKCHICYLVFKFSWTLEKHMKHHVVNPGNFDCKVCSIYFASSGLLADHMESHKAVYRCKRCPHVTYRWNAMVNHYNQHIGTEYKCIPCGKSFKSMTMYRTHMMTQLHGRFVCTICGRNSRTESRLEKHRQLRHKDEVLPENGVSVQCDECPLAFPSQEVLLTHKKYSHELVIPVHSYKKTNLDCRLCGVKAKNFTWLTHHFRKQHPAEILDLVYSDIKSHLCHHCGHGCTSANILKSHIRQKHTRSKDCNICQRKFISGKMFRHHVMSHYYDYKCGLCGRDSPRKDYLVKHLRRVHKLTGQQAHPYTIVTKKDQNTQSTDGNGVKGKTELGKRGEKGENTARSNEGKEDTAWGNDGVEENAECGNDGEKNAECGNDGEENAECGNDGEENAECGNDGEENAAWGVDGVEEDTQCGNDGEENTACGNEEEITACGYDGEEEYTQCGNDKEEENTAWRVDGVEDENAEYGNDGEEENTRFGNDGEEDNAEWDNDEASAMEEVAEDIETWGTEEEIVEHTVWGTEIQAEDVPVWVTEVQNEEAVAAGREIEVKSVRVMLRGNKLA